MTHQENAPLSVTPGAIRFNTDSMKLEYYRGGPVGFGTTTTTGEWVNLTTDSPDIQTGGTRGLISGGTTSSTDTNQIQYVNLDTTGNAIDFGDLLSDRLGGGSLASRTRGIYAGGVQNPGDGNDTDQIQFVTIASTGNATDFGNLIGVLGYINGGGSGNSTRGLFAGGATTPTYTDTDLIQYITIASTGDAVDFGDLSAAARVTNCGSSSTRSIIAGGVGHNAIDFVTISTLGNSADFGDLFNTSLWNTGMCSNSIRGVFGPNRANADGTLDGTMSYITIATLGNAIEFGESTSTRDANGAMASPTRGVWAGGRGPAPSETYQDVIDYVQIMSLGDAVDFGNLLAARRWGTGCSNGHGGL